MKKKLLYITMLFAICFAAIIPSKVEAAGAVKLNKTKLVLEMGTTYQLEVKNTTERASWTTADKRIVKVKNGIVTPVGIGTAKVTAKINGKKYSCKVTVADYSGMSIEQKEVVSYALKYVGNRYRYGGSSLTTGTDCSGFTMAVYKKFGYNLFHNAYQQMKDTKSVKKKNLAAGDLIFYGSSKRSCSHVALYIGNGKVVHASTEITGIVVSDYDYRKAVGYGRVLKTATYPNSTNENATRYATSK